jgi:hypothetical protein
VILRECKKEIIMYKGDFNPVIVSSKPQLKSIMKTKYENQEKYREVLNKMYVKSKTNYFDIKEGDIVEVVEFVKAHTEERKDGNNIEQKLDIFKVVLPNTTKVHYLYEFEVEK